MNPEEIEAIALLLERDYGFDQNGDLRAYQTDSWNLYDTDGKYHGGTPENGVIPDGLENRPFLVGWDDPTDIPNVFQSKEKAFKTAREAAEFYVLKRKEMQI